MKKNNFLAEEKIGVARLLLKRKSNNRRFTVPDVNTFYRTTIITVILNY